MKARWRLGLLLLQLAILEVGTYLAVQRSIPPEVWYASGLLAVVINPTLLEPWYPRPYDVVANSMIGILLVAWAPRQVAEPGWVALLVFLVTAATLAAAALLLGAGRGQPSGLARSARILSGHATAKVIYSAVFWLSLLEEFRVGSGDFWTLGITWGLIVFVGSINWETLWQSVTRAPRLVRAEGLLGPTTLLVSADSLPEPGTPVRAVSKGRTANGIVAARITRPNDAWAQLHLVTPEDATSLLKAGSFTIADGIATDPPVVGAVGVESTSRRLIFTTTRPLQVGQVVSVQTDQGHLLYQLTEAEIHELKVKGGSHLVVSATANHIGRFDPATSRLIQHLWTPTPGAPIQASPPRATIPPPPPNSLLLGNVIGTDGPVYLDLEVACEGHIVILGMTKMGKTTFALRLAHALAATTGVVILDGTGEYRSRRGIPAHVAQQWTPGVSVLEPKQGEIGPIFALRFVDATQKRALEEYEAGQPTPRVILIEEAHQFLPEPAGLSFNNQGRDSAYQLGVDIMQLRKYEMTMILVSQRTAVVSKSALSQCETMIAFRSVDQTGLDYLEQIAGGGVRSLLPALRQGEALALGTAVSSDRPVAVTIAH